MSPLYGGLEHEHSGSSSSTVTIRIYRSKVVSVGCWLAAAGEEEEERTYKKRGIRGGGESNNVHCSRYPLVAKLLAAAAVSSFVSGKKSEVSTEKMVAVFRKRTMNSVLIATLKRPFAAAGRLQDTYKTLRQTTWTGGSGIVVCFENVFFSRVLLSDLRQHFLPSPTQQLHSFCQRQFTSSINVRFLMLACSARGNALIGK